MSDLFRSAFNYLSQGVSAPSAAGGTTDHPLVGTSVEVGGLRLKIRSLLAEGGYALVFSAQDAQGNWFALKRQLAADREAADAVIKEIRFLRELTGHPAIIRYVQAAQLSPQESGHGRAEFLMLTELCSGGSIVEVLIKKDLTPSQVMKIFYAACSAVRHMHTRNPKISHRDIKVENLLLDSNGFVKLCDFGSATTETFQTDETWSALKRTQLEEELARFTTPMYRAPELLDLYSDFPIGPSQDIWALGCILFYLCYRKHPFEDSAKLRIINANYVLSEIDTGYNMFHPLIQTTLQIDPRKRPLASDLCERAGALAIAMGIDLTKPIDGLDLPNLNQGASSNATAGQLQKELSGYISGPQDNTRNPPPPRPSPSLAHRTEHSHDSAQQQASAMLGAIKGQGMSWFKNIKDKTTAVAQTVQSTYGGKGPDVTYITSRLVIAPLSDSVPEPLIAQAEDNMRLSVLDNAKGQFAVYNLSQRRLRCDYSNRQSETAMPMLNSLQTPSLNMIIGICKNMVLYLNQKLTNFVLITGPEAQCILQASALLLYTGLVDKRTLAINITCRKRAAILLPPSYHRLLDILATIVTTQGEDLRMMVHNRKVILESVLISPPPLFNRARTGCRPVIEVYSNGTKLWTSSTDYDQLLSYELPDCTCIDLDVGRLQVAGDVQVVLYHTRWMKMQSRMQQHVMFSVSFNANFIDQNEHLLEINRKHLDILYDDDGRFNDAFRVGLRVQVDDIDQGFNSHDMPSFLTYDPRSVKPTVLVSTTEEYDSMRYETGQGGDSLSKPRRPPPPKVQRSPQVQRSEHLLEQGQVQPKPKVEAEEPGQDLFFSTLQWNDVSLGTEPSKPGTISPDIREISQQNINQVPYIAEMESAETSLVHKDPHMLFNTTVPQRTASAVPLSGMDKAEAYERMYGIRVNNTEQNEDDDEFKFDYEKISKPKNEQLEKITAEMDLLGLGTGLNTNHSQGMQRNVSAPSFATSTVQSNKPASSFDPFAEFLATTSNNDILSQSNHGSKTNINAGSTTNSGRATPNNQKPSYNYNRSHFDAINSIGGPKPKVTENAFDDLLSYQGFSSTARSAKTMGEMKRQDEIKTMDPLDIKIRDWTRGKERNIRALLGSLNDVVWEGAGNWDQPHMGDLLTANQVKKSYRRACLLIHPDKQTGTDNENLARAIFTELNDAWTAFENAGSPSL